MEGTRTDDSEPWCCQFSSGSQRCFVKSDQCHVKLFAWEVRLNLSESNLRLQRFSSKESWENCSLLIFVYLILDKILLKFLWSSICCAQFLWNQYLHIALVVVEYLLKFQNARGTESYKTRPGPSRPRQRRQCESPGQSPSARQRSEHKSFPRYQCWRWVQPWI